MPNVKRDLFCSALLALCVPFSAIAQEPAAPTPLGPPVEPVHAWSSELLDPAGLTRFHLTTRATFGDGESVFSDSSAMSIEGRVQFRFTPGFAASVTLPIGIRTSEGPTSGTLGNIALGAMLGGDLSDQPGMLIRAAGGLDVYLPSASEDDDPIIARSNTAVAAIRSYEPMLYIPKLFSFRARGHVDMTIDIFNAALELGVTPGFDLHDEGGALVLLSMAARMSLALGTVEPFLEVANTRQIAGDGAIRPPLLITPGLRLHIADVFDPAIFVSFNFEESSAVIFGIDLAAALRPGPEKPSREKKDSHEDFLDF